MALSIETIERVFKRNFSSATKIQVLARGPESFQTIFDALRKAERFICLQFYIFRNDETGTALSEILKQRSREGVNVYLLYDHFGSLGTPRHFWAEMRRAGVHIRASRPFKWRTPFKYVHRDHRKLVVVDSQKAFTGGLNIANEYSGFHLRRRGRVWRDTGILLEGPIVRELFLIFRESWSTWRGEALPSLETEGKRSVPPRGKHIPALPIFAYSGRSRKRMRKLLSHCAEHAQRSISLTTAYFIPSRRMIQTLARAEKRGVQVKLLVPGKSDVPAASFAGRAFFGKLLEAGVEIYTYRGEMLHAKTYVFDCCWSIIGSTNLDYQSLLYNDEGNVWIFDAAFGLEMTEVFHRDLNQSIRIEKESWEKRPLLEKLKESFFALLRRGSSSLFTHSEGREEGPIFQVSQGDRSG